MVYNYNEWLIHNQPEIFCKCGCGEKIIVKKRPHKYIGIPEHILGHYLKILVNNPNILKCDDLSESYKQWLKNNKPKIYCKCDCGKEIIITKRYKRRGIPQYIHGHKIHNSYSKWLISPYKIFCMCGCCEEIIINSNYKYYGIPKYVVGHNGIGKNNPNYNGGKSFEPYCEKFNERKKEEVREQYNRKCYICGKDEKENITKTGKQYKLSVHHIDNDKEQGCNGKKWKLAPLCLHCHNSKKMECLLL